MDFNLETERLKLRHAALTDAGFIVELLNSKGWLEYIGDRKVRTIEDAEAYLQNGPIKSYREHGFGLSVVSRKEDEKVVGACGLLKRDYLHGPDLGFAFLPDNIGKGYGYESATSVLKWAKDELGISSVFAFTVPHNVASIKLLEKLGFSFDKNFVIPGETDELMLFKKDLEESVWE